MSDILNTVHNTAAGLLKSGVISQTTMKDFDELCLTKIIEFDASRVRQLRKQYGLSQPVFARYLNVSDKLVKKWEQGDSLPKGAALKMLSIIETKGLDAIA